MWKIFGNKDLFSVIGRYLSMEDSLSLYWAVPCTRLECMVWTRKEQEFGRMLAIVRLENGRVISQPYMYLCDVAHFFHQSKLTVCFIDGKTGTLEIMLKNGQYYFCHLVETLSTKPIEFAHLTL